MSKTKLIRALGIILFNLFFIWLSLFLLKIFLVSGLFADDLMRVDLSKSELQRLRFIKDAMVDSSPDSLWFFSAILFCLAASSFVCYWEMRNHVNYGDTSNDAYKFMQQNNTAAIWWFSALASSILLALPPFASANLGELRKEREVSSRVFNTLDKEKQHVNFMMRSGRLSELKEEYPKFVNGQEMALTLDQTTLTSLSLNNPISSIPFASAQSTKAAGLSSFEAVKDIMFFTEEQSTSKALTIQADILKAEINTSMTTVSFVIRAFKDTCISLIASVETASSRKEKLLLTHNEQQFCVKAGVMQEVLIDVRRKALPRKVKLELFLDNPAEVEISDAALTLVENYKERYFDSSFCLEGKDLAYPKNIRSYLYIPSYSSLDSAANLKLFSSLTCQQAILGKKFNYPYTSE